ncbi:MAG: D-glycerate dehydrogenase [Candidatus Kapabacteria bacterium]|nr:D-glycerate dehydrogenase [Candidatus Kapabacteria bacterium]
METKILITRRINESAVKLLREHFEVDYRNINEPLSNDYLSENAPKYDGILSTITEKFDEELLKRASSRLKAISNMAVGLDNIDIKTAEKLGISIFNTPDVVTDSTADFTLAIGLAFLRQIVDSFEFIKKNEWKKWDPEIFNGRTLRNINWGIIGFGRVGKAVAERLKGFGVKIYYTDVNPINTIDFDFATNLEFDELLNISDVISIHIPLNQNTKGLINYNNFKKMQRKPLIINMARGSIVNTDDLIKALNENLISGAALDVFDPEPISSDHSILKYKNVLITPHIGTATIDCRKEMAMLAAQNLINFFKGL